MKIIESIESSFGGITFGVKDTNFYLRIKGQDIVNIIYIHETGELWADHLDVRIMTHYIDNLVDMAVTLKLSPILCVEFLDRHAYMTIKPRDRSQWDDCLFFPKENMTEIKGGKYNVEDTIENLPKAISGGRNE